MTWEAASAIAQILGSVAIVVTLIYLAVQIRQANHAMLMAGYHQINEQWHRWSELVVTTSDLPGAILRGNASLRDLTAEEALRYGSYAQNVFRYRRKLSAPYPTAWSRSRGEGLAIDRQPPDCRTRDDGMVAGKSVRLFQRNGPLD
jgi:hypothetical protein